MTTKRLENTNDKEMKRKKVISSSGVDFNECNEGRPPKDFCGQKPRTQENELFCKDFRDGVKLMGFM